MSEWALETFKAYDIRGIAGSQLSTAFAYRLGQALPTYLDCSALAVGRDIRESSPELHEALVEGLLSTGCHVHDIGICTTGALYSATVNVVTGGGVMITASHNPVSDSGIKVFDSSGFKTNPELEKEISELVIQLAAEEREVDQNDLMELANPDSYFNADLAHQALKTYNSHIVKPICIV